MSLPPPLTITAQPDGNIGFSIGPSSEFERLLLVGLLHRATMAMSSIKLPKPGIIPANGQDAKAIDQITRVLKQRQDKRP